MKLDATAFDTAEPIERLPRFTQGEYTVTVDRAEYKDFSNTLVIETTIESSSGEGALPAGTRAAHIIGTVAKSKKQAPYVAKRVKSFVYPALGRRNIPGEELKDIIENQANLFEGKRLKVTVKPQVDDDGEVRTNDAGIPWTETEFASL